MRLFLSEILGTRIEPAPTEPESGAACLDDLVRAASPFDVCELLPSAGDTAKVPPVYSATLWGLIKKLPLIKKNILRNHSSSEIILESAHKSTNII